MANDVAIDEVLLAEAVRLTGLGREATVAEALREYVQRRKQVGILELFGTIDYDPTHDHKAQRSRR